MGFQVSPGVEVKEIDLTNVIPAVSTSIGGFAGYFKWGPVNQIALISSEKGLLQKFGKPDSSALYADPFFQAASFLQYGDALKVVRAGSSADFSNASDADSVDSPDNGVWIPNQTYFEESFTSPEGGTFAARYPGKAGNSLKVYALNAANYAGLTDASPISAEEEAVYNVFDLAPDADEIHIAVVDTAGVFGEAGAIIEKFAGLSITKTAKTAAGATNYIKNVINSQSQYIYLIKGDSDDFDVDSFEAYDSPLFQAGVFQLGGGIEASDETSLDTDTQTALDFLADAETEDVNLIFSQIMSSGALLQNYAHSIAYSRKDAVAFLSPPKSATVNQTNPLTQVKSFANNDITNRGNDGSYGVIDSGALYIYDRYNDVYRYIPANGHIAGLCANTDDVAEPWFSPAGFNRGGLRNIVKLAYNPKKADRDELYKAGINPIAAFPGQGIVLFGDKTAQAKPSAFDRINVRRLFIVLEKAIATAAKYQLFELNDEFTRATFRNAVEPFLRDVQARRGVTDFLVVCDETNNTGEVIDTNRFVADIYIKPARSINFITLNFIATRTGVDFAEVAGLSNA
jgi:phage tail sheath protein FI